MKKIISFYKFLLFTLIVAGIYSCKDMMDFHKEYIKNGEIVYLSKMDSVVSYPGKNRIQLSGYLNNGYNVNKIAVYWNSRADSMIFNYTKSKTIDSLNLIIPNLAEQSYIFEIYTTNTAGNRSIKVPIAGTVYGEIYRKTLVARSSNGFDYDGKQLKSLWLTADDLERGTTIRYTTETSGIATLLLSTSLSEIVLPKLKFGTSFSFRSVYVPEKTAIDTFYSAWTTMPVTFNPYVGDYHSVGFLTHPTPSSSRAFDRDKVLKRIDDETLELELGDLASSNYYMRLKVNSDNTITLTPSGVTPNIDQKYGKNYYDPVTKTFYLNYAYNVAAPRIISEVISKPTEEKVSKTGWKITGFSSEEPGEGAPNGLATAAIDNNLNTFWHSQWDSNTPPPYPHWFTVDMGVSVTITSIEVFRRQGNGNGQTKHQFFYSSNGTTWTDFGTFSMNSTIDSGQKFKSTTTPTARYIKYIALEGPDFYAFLGELNVYTPIK